MIEKRICSSCYEEKEITEFVNSKSRNIHHCRVCVSKKYKEQYRSWQEENCGGDRIPVKPNTYSNDIQRQCVFAIMQNLGYLFNESNGIWWKPDYKDENGNFLYVEKRSKRLFSNCKKIPKDLRKKCIDYYKSGYSQVRINQVMNISITTIGKIIKEYEKNKSR